MDDNAIYRDVFFEETDTNLAILNEEVLRLEQHPSDHHIIDAIFRAAHTLKGMAATMGYTTMTELTHALENIFEQFKNQDALVTSDTISLIFDCLDALTEIVENLKIGDEAVLNIESLLSRLDSVIKYTEKDSQLDSSNHHVEDKENKILHFDLEEADIVAINTASQEGYNALGIYVKIDSESIMKSARAYVVINSLETKGDLLFTEPSIDKIEEGEFGNYFKLVLLSKGDKKGIQEDIYGTSEIEEVLIDELTEKQINLLSEYNIEESNRPVQSEKEIDKKTTTKKSQSISRQTIRVDLERLDQFMNLVSELVIHRTRLEDVSAKKQLNELSDPLTQVGNITSELQELVLQLRMQPFNIVVQRFPRMVRDLAKELKKNIQFITEGEETELDRTVISEIGEPLIHLLRNACDHGIEDPTERETLGKPNKGTIKLSAYPEGNRVVVSLSDDGNGLDPKAIKESAQKKGIKTDGLSDEEIQQLIFHPGFSTAAQLSDVSGRGVGMDAVKEKISSLNGTIETISKVGEGTTFRITLPLTLSIIQSLLVESGNETFAIPQAVIEKVDKFEERDAIQAHKQEVYDYNGKTIPVVRLNEALKLKAQEDTDKHIVIVLLGDQHYSVVIDRLVHQKEIVIKPLGKELNQLHTFLGATILGDGSVSLILDLTAICTERKEVSG